MPHEIQWSSYDIDPKVIEKVFGTIPEIMPTDPFMLFTKREGDLYYFQRSDLSEFVMETNIDLPLVVGKKYSITPSFEQPDNAIEKKLVISFDNPDKHPTQNTFQ